MNTHRINRQIVDIDVPADHEAADISRRIVENAKFDLQQVIEEALDSVPLHEKLSLNTIELDAGTLRREYLEADLNTRIKHLLTDYLRSQRYKSEYVLHKDTLSQEEYGKTITEALFYVLRHGVLPAWAGTSHFHNISALLEEVLSFHPAFFIKMLRQYRHHDAMKRRLVAHLSERSLHQLLKALNPAEARFVISYLHDIRMLHRESPIAPQVAEHTLMREVHYLVISYLLARQGFFDKKAFIKNQLEGIALRFGQSYETLLGFLQKAVSALPMMITFYSTLPFIILSLHEDAKHSAPKTPSTSSSTTEKATMETVAHLLKYGTTPWWIPSPSFTSVSNTLMNWLKKTSTREVRKELVQWSSGFPAPRHLATLFKDEHIKAVVRAIEPSHADFIISYSDYLEKKHSQHPLSGKPKSEFRQIKWDVILTYLLVDRGSRFNRKSFIKRTVERLSSAYSITYAALLTFLTDALQKTASSIRKREAFGAILLELKDEIKPTKSFSQEAEQGAKDKTKKTERAHHLVFYVVTHGELPMWALKTDQPHFATFIRQVMNTRPGELADVLSASRKTEKGIRWLSRHTTATSLKKWLGSVSQPEALPYSTLLPLVDFLKSSFSIQQNAKDTYLLVLRYVLKMQRKPSVSPLLVLLNMLSEAWQITIEKMRDAISQQTDEEWYKMISAQLQTGSPATDAASAKETTPNATSTGKRTVAEKALYALPEMQWLYDYFQQNTTSSKETLRPNIQQLNEWVEIVLRRKGVNVVSFLQDLRSSSEAETFLFVGLDAEHVKEVYTHLRKWNIAFFDAVRDDIVTLLVAMKRFPLNRDDADGWLLRFYIWQVMQSPGKELNQQTFIRALAEHLSRFINTPLSDIWSEWSTLLPEIAMQLRSSLPLTLVKLKKAYVKGEKEAASHPAKKDEDKKITPEKEEQEDDTEEMELPDSVPIYNSGLVLLWPFVSRYLEMNGLMKDGAFPSLEKHNRAVHLLQYLVSGEEHFPEHELLLNKIICGWNWDEIVVPETSPITEEEQTISEQLLKALIEQWSKIGQTSVEGLRQSFLMREGKLISDNDKWTLVVENKAFDMLLDHFPFSFSTIKLKWMEKPIVVEWR